MNTSTPRFWQSALLLVIVAGVILLALSGYLNPVLRAALSPLVTIQSWMSTRYMAVFEFLTVPRDVASLRQRNADLENQVSQLQAQVITLQQQQREAAVVAALVDFARDRPENAYKSAAVIGLDPSPFMRYIIIDRGSDDGLRHGMPVVTKQGLVGRIDAVTGSAARVQLITDPGAKVNVHLQSVRTEAMLNGSVTGDISIDMVPQDTDLKIGEVVLTSGLGGNYPADVLIGQVITVRKRENDLFQSASIQPAVDFSHLQAVLIITNFRPVDITPLVPGQVP